MSLYVGGRYVSGLFTIEQLQFFLLTIENYKEETRTKVVGKHTSGNNFPAEIQVLNSYFGKSRGLQGDVVYLS